MNGQMEEDTRVPGKTTKWMEKESLIGLTKGGTLENTKMTKRKAMVILHGQMEDNTKEAGLMENNMEKGSISHLLVKNEKDFGKTENE